MMRAGLDRRSRVTGTGAPTGDSIQPGKSGYDFRGTQYWGRVKTVMWANGNCPLIKCTLQYWRYLSENRQIFLRRK